MHCRSRQCWCTCAAPVSLPQIRHWTERVTHPLTSPSGRGPRASRTLFFSRLPSSSILRVRLMYPSSVPCLFFVPSSSHLRPSFTVLLPPQQVAEAAKYYNRYVVCTGTCIRRGVGETTPRRNSMRAACVFARPEPVSVPRRKGAKEEKGRKRVGGAGKQEG